MDTWKAFEANELTHSAAHHLVAIYDVGQDYGGWARVSDIARQLNITRGSVSINLRALKRRALVQTDDHRLVKLTDEGLRAARAVMAKRVLVVTFLSEVLGVPADQAEIDSCKIEHLVSDETGHRLAQFLRFVSSDGEAAELLGRFQRFRCRCPKSADCGLCKGRCLVDELKRAI